MKKIDLEKMLMDPEGLKRLAERAAAIKQKLGILGDTEGSETFKVLSVDPLAHEERPTLDEIHANDYDYSVRSDLATNLTRFVPEVEQEDIKAALKALTERCKKNPSASNQLLLEDLINRMVSQGELDHDSQNLLNEAVKVLESTGIPEQRKEEGK